MSKEIRRLHRKKTFLTNFSGTKKPELTNPIESIEPNIEHSNLLSPCLSQINSSSSDIGHNNTNSIRADLLEDFHHSEFAESDFSDDTHDWGGDSQLLSDDYWHFLGSYE